MSDVSRRCESGGGDKLVAAQGNGHQLPACFTRPSGHASECGRGQMPDPWPCGGEQRPSVPGRVPQAKGNDHQGGERAGINQGTVLKTKPSKPPREGVLELNRSHEPLLTRPPTRPPTPPLQPHPHQTLNP